MSRQEAVAAFLDGRISRRSLVQRLIAGGVSAGAAVSYAHLLKPELAQGEAIVTSDHYPLVDLVINTTSLANTISKGSIGVTVTSTEELRNASFRTFVKDPPGGILIGGRFVANLLSTAGSRQLTLMIDPSSLSGRSAATLYVQILANDDELFGTVASARKRLT